MQDKKEIMMKLLYEEAKQMLKEYTPKDANISKYFNIEKSFMTKNDILFTLLIALQDKQMSYNVIGILREERKDIFRKLLFGFDCKMILANYDEKTLLETFNKNFTIKNIDSKQNLWRLYAKSVISAANFINEFSSIEEFDNFIKKYDNNKIELITLLQNKVYGLGFALACNFLKDLGYSDYSKPDVHIKDIFLAFDFCDKDDYSVFNAVSEMSSLVKDSAFNIDRLLWFLCSGKIDDVKIGKHKDELINRVKDKFAKLETNNIYDNKEIITLGTTKCSKFKNNYKYNYSRITLNSQITEMFFSGNSKDKKVIDVIVKYDKNKDILIIEKIV